MEQIGRLRGDKGLNPGVGPRLAQLRDDVGVEQPAPQSSTSRTGALIDTRSSSMSRNGESRSAATIAAPVSWRPQAIVVFGRDHHDGVPAMDRDALWLVVAGAADHLAETRLGVLQPPTVIATGRGRSGHIAVLTSGHEPSLSGHTSQNMMGHANHCKHNGDCRIAELGPATCNLVERCPDGGGPGRSGSALLLPAGEGGGGAVGGRLTGRDRVGNRGGAGERLCQLQVDVVRSAS